jgi:pimeloyl-ACP methyl ester carboxylesterase
MQVAPKGSTFTGITHQEVELNRTKLHYVSAGDQGSPILLVHGFPETWWTFRDLIPLLAASHRVFCGRFAWLW